jgi:hypothetical protein
VLIYIGLQAFKIRRVALTDQAVRLSDDKLCIFTGVKQFLRSARKPSVFLGTSLRTSGQRLPARGIKGRLDCDLLRPGNIAFPASGPKVMR